MPNASTLTPDSRFIALFVGKSGSGKTPAACSWVHEGRVKDWDFDGRIRGLMGCPWIDRSKVDYEYYPVVNLSTNIDLTFNRLNRDLEVVQIESKSGQHKYKTHVIDSLTAEAF
ncbi:MAG: hypothetical protein KGN01_07615, partial [Patescibacteria group bacterium]|nr:hypothetical protein [Patescibacteria group bacterium]